VQAPEVVSAAEVVSVSDSARVQESESAWVRALVRASELALAQVWVSGWALESVQVRAQPPV
jgi:hypothetical protein